MSKNKPQKAKSPEKRKKQQERIRKSEALWRADEERMTMKMVMTGGSREETE